MSPVQTDSRETQDWTAPALTYAKEWAERVPVQKLASLPVLAFVIAVVPFSWHVWTTLHGYFTQDDYVYIYRATHQSLSLHYLFSSYNGHIIPGEFLLAWLVTWLAPMSWPVAVLPVLALQAFAAVLFWRLLHKLFGEQWGILVPFAIFCLSPVLLVTPLWWAFALEIVPLVVCALGAADALVSYIQTGQRRHGVVCVAYVVVGLIFWEKTALVVPLLFALALFLSPKADLKSAFGSTLKRGRWLWTALAVVLGVYGVVYLRLAALETRSGLPAKHLPELVGLMLRELIGWLIGGPWGHTITGPAPRGAAFAVFALVALMVIGAAVVLRGKRAALAWLIVLAYLAVDVFLVAFARLSGAGPIIGQDPRYIADAVLVVLIFGTLAFLQPQGTKPAESVDAAPAGRGAVLTTVAVIAVVAIASTAATQSSQLNRQARAFRANAIQSLKDNGQPVVFDGGVPNAVMLTEFGSEARVSRVLGPASSLARFDAPTEDLLTFDASGFLQSFEFYFPATALPGSDPKCSYSTSSDGVTVPFDKVVNEPRVVVKLVYATATSTKGFVDAGGRHIGVTFSPGPSRSLFVVVPGPLAGVKVGSASSICVVSAVAGGPAPVEPRTPTSQGQ